MAKNEMETLMMQKVSDAITSINAAKCVDDVIISLHSLASLLFPVHSPSLSGMMSERYKEKVSKEEIPSVHERSKLWEVFYRGVAFPTLARYLLYDVASSWLSCFPLTARKLVYDVFFIKGLVTEVVQAVVPFLDHNSTAGQDAKAVRSNAERLVELCLLENEGVIQLARELSIYLQSKDSSPSVTKLTVSRVAQLVASVPDKTHLGAQRSLSSHLFFKNITVQLLKGAEEESSKVYLTEDGYCSSKVDGAFLFVGEMFTRISRRGSTDLLLSELIPWILRRVRIIISSNKDMTVEDCFKSEPSFQFWFMMVEIIKDAYVVERLAEHILHQLKAEHANDIEAYWILWILFHRSCKDSTTMRLMFLEKFLLRKVFPLCCLRWVLQFAVFCCPPDSDKLKKGESNLCLLDAIQRGITLWSKLEFVQSAPLEQQLYVTATVGLMLENISREELESTKDVMRSILEGVSCRLESPDELIRKMASNIALVFSIVVDPKNPLYLDDSCKGESVDWEFGLASPNKDIAITANGANDHKESAESIAGCLQNMELNHVDSNETRSKVNARKNSLQHKLVDPDEVIDPAALNGELFLGEEDDNASEDSEESSDSLQPYDLTDDDTDLKKRFSHLVDVVGALRKPDDPDGVERALDVAEKLVRASPDELRYVASDLTRTLVQVRCADATVEGEEDSAEEKRQKALLALLVTCPLESVEAMNKLLYSPHVDVSQRVMILDTMTDAVQELANTKTVIQKSRSKPLISSIEPQPWFLPSNRGPTGAGSWKEVSNTDTPLNWTYSYERALPSKSSLAKKGKTRRWGNRLAPVEANEVDWSLNKFPLYAAAFMLPAMQGFDKKRHGVDLLGRDFIVLGKLVYMLGVCIRCMALHPEAFALASPLLDMLSSREVCQHKEAYVRRSVLFAASCTLTALHPSFVASALIEGNQEVSRGLEWIRVFALQVAESDPDKECYSMAMACLQLHAEMALHASRALQSPEITLQEKKSIDFPSNLSKVMIKIPGLSDSFLG